MAYPFHRRAHELFLAAILILPSNTLLPSPLMEYDILPIGALDPPSYAGQPKFQEILSLNQFRETNEDKWETILIFGGNFDSTTFIAYALQAIPRPDPTGIPIYMIEAIFQLDSNDKGESRFRKEIKIENSEIFTEFILINRAMMIRSNNSKLLYSIPSEKFYFFFQAHEMSGHLPNGAPRNSTGGALLSLWCNLINAESLRTGQNPLADDPDFLSKLKSLHYLVDQDVHKIAIQDYASSQYRPVPLDFFETGDLFDINALRNLLD